MSDFLGAYFEKIDFSATISDVQNELVGALTAYGWQVIGSSAGVYSDVIPPVSESIGDGRFIEVTRIHFNNNTTITLECYQKCVADAFAQSIRVKSKTAGAVQAGVTIDGVQVLGASGSSDSSANDNLRSLFYALMDSTNPVITAWKHWYNGSDTIISTRNIISSSELTCSGNGNVDYFPFGAPVMAGDVNDFTLIDSVYGSSVTIDLTNGFIYALSVFSRTFTLATKCLSGFYGPVFASYADHAEAVSATPDSDLCTPIELTVGTITGTHALGRHTHWWGYGTSFAARHSVSNTGSSYRNASDSSKEWNPWTRVLPPFVMSDVPVSYSYYSGVSLSSMNPQTDILRQGLEAGDNVFIDMLKVVSGASMSPSMVEGQSSYRASNRFIYGINFPDIFFWSGSEPNESCALVCDAPLNGLGVGDITLQQDVDGSSNYAMLSVSSTTGLPSSGDVLIGVEVFRYAGKTSNTITGVTRNINGSGMARHFVGDAIAPGLWFMKMNTGAMLFGPEQPS